jgi:putative effector of murein hydrolase LrgA (UPF0299 family)
MMDSKRIQITVLLSVLLLSSTTMTWLFRHFPLPTSLAAIVLLATMFQCARIARTIDSAVSALDGGKQRVAPALRER